MDGRRAKDCWVGAMAIDVGRVEVWGLEFDVDVLEKRLCTLDRLLQTIVFFFSLFQRVSGGWASAVEDIYRMGDVVVMGFE